MTELESWLEKNLGMLIQAAVEEIAHTEPQKAQVTDIVTDFFHSFLEAVRQKDSQPLSEHMASWVAGRSAPAEGQFSSLMPVLVSIKESSLNRVRRLQQPELAVKFLIELDMIYNQAINDLSQMEADALLADMRSELAKAQYQLERLDKSKSDFVAVAAHELRTPITLVEGYSNMMRMNLGELSHDPSLAPLLTGIESGVGRLREIIRDMLDVSLISLDMIELHLQPTWLLQVVDAVDRSMAAYLHDRNLELIVERSTIPRQPTYADPERLTQVLQKIVSNAIKFTPDGGKIAIRARELTGFTDLMVIDNGIGIAPNDLGHIFTMFSSLGDSALHSSSKTKFRGGGPGLGLFISKGLIEAHGGNIWAESPGFDEIACPGSTFHIMIPMRTAPQSDKMSSAVFKK
jgi:signal transduction histidine kinase